jgi:hypothetical protein
LQLVNGQIARCGNGSTEKLQNGGRAAKIEGGIKFYANLSDIREIEIVRSQH